MKNSYDILLSFKKYVYKNTIAQADTESGDSANRVGTFHALCGMSNLAGGVVLNYTTAVRALNPTPGVYVRTPDESHWGNNPNNFSRDQWQALQLAFAVNKDTMRLKESMKALRGRYFLHQNTHTGAPPSTKKIPDLAHPSHFSVYIRGLELTRYYPLLYLIDLLFLGDIVLRKYADSANDVDNMIAPQLLFANLRMPTLVSKLAMKLYLRTNFLTKLAAYHSVERNGILPFTDLVEYAYNVNGYVTKETKI